MRSLVLLVVIGFAFSLVVPTVRSFLAQRADVVALEREVAAARALDADLEAELARWKDPAFVTWQARERLAYVLPGEVAYRVVDPEIVDTAPVGEEPVEPETPPSGVLTPTADQPWFASIWESVQVAGETDVVTDDAPDQGGQDAPTAGSTSGDAEADGDGDAPVADDTILSDGEDSP